MKKAAILLVTIVLVSSVAVGATAFDDTELLDSDNTDPDRIAEQTRVDSEDASNITIDLKHISKDSAKFKINGSSNTTTFYVKADLEIDGTSISIREGDVVLYFDGTEQSYSVVEEDGDNWIRTTVDLDNTGQIARVAREGANLEPGPSDVSGASFNDTSHVSETDVSAESDIDERTTADSVRAESSSDMTIDVRNSTSEAVFEITRTENSSTTFYVKKSYIINTVPTADESLSNVGALLDGESLDYNITTIDGEDWVVFEVNHFSTRTVKFSAVSVSDSISGIGMIFRLKFFGIPVWVIAAGVIVAIAAGIWKLRSGQQDRLYIQP